MKNTMCASTFTILIATSIQVSKSAFADNITLTKSSVARRPPSPSPSKVTPPVAFYGELDLTSPALSPSSHSRPVNTLAPTAFRLVSGSSNRISQDSSKGTSSIDGKTTTGRNAPSEEPTKEAATKGVEAFSLMAVAAVLLVSSVACLAFLARRVKSRSWLAKELTNAEKTSEVANDTDRNSIDDLQKPVSELDVMEEVSSISSINSDSVLLTGINFDAILANVGEGSSFQEHELISI